MIFQQRNGVVRREDPVVEWGLRTSGPSSPRLRCCCRRNLSSQPLWRQERSSAALRLEQRRRRRIQQFFRPQLLQLLLHPPQRALSRKFRSAKLPGGEIQGGEPHTFSNLRQGRQKIVFLR